MWDAFQREMLGALGHTLYRLRGPDEPSLESEPVAAASVSRRPAAGQSPARLLAAIARAAGIAPDRLPSALPGLPSLQLLRGDAAAKRALWPRLRALRTSGCPG